ncbi:toll/interleukin-1 receptor domain-containing protein [Mesorhizobium escarrei]|uniref:TIR domain-containing protein n=1 Tax=Mesorhizobium escarrei TaxID=666018 RepID=A0ABM9E194_9HYPH|nr:toll/interleukin-1 receptor domain-containing protein [Mesorhizobium escarrei]CAH2402774.1 conserved hypothetical protein [Mesorhizobium escarrei]
MNIFICWSEERSRLLAKVLGSYLPQFIPGLQETSLFMSDNIPKGTRWFDAVEKELERANAGLVCVTREALQSGWIHFEAGALARAVRKNEKQSGGALYTYLLGVSPDELRGPLGAFQSTTFDREDTKKLCAAIVTSMKPDAPRREEWEKAFDDNWTKFKDAVKTIGPLPADKLIPDLEEIFRRKTFNEPIEECARQSWIDRFTGARETIAGLRTYGATMKADNSYLLDLYNELLEELDGYAMNMGALLLTENRFEISPDDGKLAIGNGIKRACESRRGRIRQLVTHLLAPNCAPVLEAESRRYAKIPSFEAKKAIMIHPAEWEIQRTFNGKETSKLTKDQLSACAVSLWEFDRIYFYLVQERSVSANIGQLVECLEQEFEKLRAVDGGSSLIPLHYATRATKRTLARPAVRRKKAEISTKVRLLLTSIEQFLKEYDLDKSQQVRDNIKEFRALLDVPVGEAAGQRLSEEASPVASPY